MTEQLHERLADLAGSAPTAPAAGASDLWRSGKRRQRRRTAAGAVAACAVVLAGVGGAGLVLPQRDAFPEPSGSQAVAALPDELHAPPGWLESNDDDPVGPFAVMWMSQEQDSADATSYVGVSAVTGEYRRVEMPGLADAGLMDDAAVLSPSGRYIAYWAAAAERPDQSEDLSENLPGRPGVYDTVAGRDLEMSWELADETEAPHGLGVWDLRWVDDERLYVQAGAIQGPPGSDGASGTRALGAGWVADISDGGRVRPLDVPGMARIGDVAASDGEGHLLVRAQGKRAGHLFVDPAQPQGARPVQMRMPGDGGSSGLRRASPDGGVAAARQSEDGVASLAVTDVDGPGKVFRQVRAHDVFGWSDRTHVVVAVAADAGGQGGRILEVDVTTGKVTDLITMPGEHINPLQLASALLDTPPVDRGEPDWPTDPRIFVGLGAGALLLIVLALRIWRRRERG